MAKRVLLSLVVVAGVSCPSRTDTAGGQRDQMSFSYLGSCGERQFWLGTGVEGIAVGPGDEWLVSAGRDGRLHVWDVASGKKTRSIDAHEGVALCVDVTDDGRTIVSGGGYGSLCIWDTESGDLVHRAGGVDPIPPDLAREFGPRIDDTAVYCLSLAPGDKRVALGRGNGAVELWDVQTGKLLRMFAGHEDGVGGKYVTTVCWDPTGKWFATGGADEYIRIWDAASGSVIRQLKGPKQRMGGSTVVDIVGALEVSADGTRVLSAGDGGSVQSWEVETGRLLRTYPEHRWNVFAAAFEVDKEWVVSGGANGHWYVWDPRTAERQPRLVSWPGRGRIDEIVASRDGKWLATGGTDGAIRLWDAGTGEELRKPTGHTEQVTCLVADPKGTWIASGSADATVRFWDARSGAAMQTILGHERRITALAVTPDGERLVSGSWGRLTVWTVPGGKVERTWRAHGRVANALVVTGDGHRLISGGLDEVGGTSSVKTWDMSTGEEIRRIDNFNGSVNHVFMNPTEQHLVTESTLGAKTRGWWGLGANDWPCRIRVWDPESGKKIQTISANESRVVAAALSPDGLVLAAAGVEGTVTVWDVGRGEAIRKLGGARGEVTAAAFSRDGRWVLACETEDRFVTGYLKVWEVATGAQLGSVEVEVAPTCMLVHGSVVWLGAADGSIRRYALRHW
jgi:WD40 repeat protein